MKKRIFSALVISLAVVSLIVIFGCKGKKGGPTDLSTFTSFYPGKSYAIELTYASQVCNVDMTGWEDWKDHANDPTGIHGYVCDPLLATLTVIDQNTDTGEIVIQYTELEGTGCAGAGWYAYNGSYPGCFTFTVTGTIDEQGFFTASGKIPNDCWGWNLVDGLINSSCQTPEYANFILHMDGKISLTDQTIEGNFSFQDNDPWWDAYFGDCNPWDGATSKFCCEVPQWNTVYQDCPEPLNSGATYLNFPCYNGVTGSPVQDAFTCVDPTNPLPATCGSAYCDLLGNPLDPAMTCADTWYYMNVIDTCYYNETFTGALIVP